jgi:hypothetical protein
VSFVVPPQAETPLDPPSSPEIAAFVPGGSAFPSEEVSKSEVEVWRDVSEYPQMPVRRGLQFDQALVTGREPVLVRLQFSPLAAGKAVTVRPGPGVTVDPPETEFHVDANGECVVSVLLDPSYPRSAITVFCDGNKTTLPLSRATVELVEAAEEAAGDGQ